MANVDNVWVIEGDGTISIVDSMSEPPRLAAFSNLVTRNVLTFHAGSTIFNNGKTCPETHQPCYDAYCLSTGKCVMAD